VPRWMALTCGNVLRQRLCRMVRSVRIEELTSNLSSPIRFMPKGAAVGRGPTDVAKARREDPCLDPTDLRRRAQELTRNIVDRQASLLPQLTKSAGQFPEARSELKPGTNSHSITGVLELGIS
jgi:hypothetical protein